MRTFGFGQLFGLRVGTGRHGDQCSRAAVQRPVASAIYRALSQPQHTSGFSLKTTVARTWARKGRTPTVPTKLRWEHLSVIGAVTTTGKFLQHTHAGAIRAQHVVKFLKHVMAHVTGEVIVLLDRAMIHRAKCVQALVDEHSRLTLEYLPPYAPEFNAVEWLWAWVKRNVLGNFCARNVTELRGKLRSAWGRVRSAKLVPSFFAACDLGVSCAVLAGTRNAATMKWRS